MDDHVEQIYHCAECGARVQLTDGVAQRECEHSTAAILADMYATVYGKAEVA